MRILSRFLTHDVTTSSFIASPTYFTLTRSQLECMMRTALAYCRGVMGANVAQAVAPVGGTWHLGEGLFLDNLPPNHWTCNLSASPAQPVLLLCGGDGSHPETDAWDKIPPDLPSHRLAGLCTRNQ